MKDPLDKAERSALMSKVRGKGNVSTEGKVEATLIEHNIGGWQKHPKDILGKPDFFFLRLRLALFVDGCFWHACPICKRNTPTNRAEFWLNKIDTNRRRDNRIHRKLWRQGYHVMRVWEHELKKDLWLKRLQVMIKKLDKNLVEGRPPN